MMEKQAMTPTTRRSRTRLFVCGALAALCMQGVGAQEIDLGEAGQYAAFILGNASGLARVEGRLAVGGDLESAAMDIGTSLARDSVDQAALVVGGDITSYRLGNIYDEGGRRGYGIYRGVKSNVSGQIDLRDGDLPLDFDAEANWLTMQSAQLAARPVTGTASALLFVLTLRGTNADVEVFSLSAAQVGFGNILRLANVKAGATIVINVRPDAQRQVRLLMNQDALRPYQQRVLFNFPDTDVLRLDGTHVYGSILAPFACAQGVGGRVDGTLVAASLNGATAIGHVPFIARP
jgi:choice-of-anchor A domain-containing protein